MNVLSLDAEYNQPSQKTVQIGAAVFDVETGAMIESLDIMVNPKEAVNPFITQLTTITQEQVDGGISIGEAFQKLKEFHSKNKCLVNPIVWGSGVRNDSLSLYQESGDTEPNFMGFRVIDVKTIYQSKRIISNMGVKAGLKTACKKEKIGFLGTEHTALADAVNTFRLWHHLVQSFK